MADEHTNHLRDKIIKEADKLEEFWQPRRRRQTEMRNLRDRIEIPGENEVSPFQIGRNHTVKGKPGFENYVSNIARIQWEGLQSILANSKVKPRIPLSTFSDNGDEEMSKEGMAERFSAGVLREWDIRNREIRGGSGFFWDVAFYVAGGYITGFPHIEKQGKQISFVNDLWDPINVYEERDGNGLVTLIHRYKVTPDGAMNLFGPDTRFPTPFQSTSEETKEVDVINSWKRGEKRRGGGFHIFNAVIVDGEFVKPVTEEKAFRYIPIIHLPVGGYPERAFRKDIVQERDWMDRLGMAFIDIIASSVKQYDRVMTLNMQIMALAAFGITTFFTEEGDMPFTREQLEGMGAGAQLALRVGESLERFTSVGSPVELSTTLQTVLSEINEGGLPPSAFGQAGVGESGFLHDMLLVPVQNKIGRYWDAYRYFLGRCLTVTLQQFRSGNFGDVSMTFASAGIGERGGFQRQDFSKDDMPDVTFIEMVGEMALPRDKFSRLQGARMARQDPPILPQLMILDEWIQVDDPMEVMRLIREDELRNEPITKQFEMLRAKILKRAALMAKEDKDDVDRAEIDFLGRFIDLEFANLSGQSDANGTGVQGLGQGQLPAELAQMTGRAAGQALVGATPGRQQAGFGRNRETSRLNGLGLFGAGQ